MKLMEKMIYRKYKDLGIKSIDRICANRKEKFICTENCCAGC